MGLDMTVQSAQQRVGDPPHSAWLEWSQTVASTPLKRHFASTRGRMGPLGGIPADARASDAGQAPDRVTVRGGQATQWVWKLPSG